MKKRTRLVLAGCVSVAGIVVLGYWIYGTIVTRALVGMFEALGLPPQVSESLIWDVLPFIGSALILIAVALLFAPMVRRKFAKSGL